MIDAIAKVRATTIVSPGLGSAHESTHPGAGGFRLEATAANRTERGPLGTVLYVDDDPWAEYAEHWDEDAAGYAEAAFTHLQQVLADAGPPLDGAVVCDFGAGTGLLVERLVGRVGRIDAVDSSPVMLDRIRAKIEANGWSTVSASPEVPDTGQAYDLVVCSSVLGFVDDLNAVVATLAGRLSPGGALVQWDWERTDDHGHGLTRDEVRSALTSAGLTDVRVGGAFTITIEGEPVTPLYGAGWRR